MLRAGDDSGAFRAQALGASLLEATCRGLVRRRRGALGQHVTCKVTNTVVTWVV